MEESGRRSFYLWLLPVAWGLCCIFAFRHPGDEYGMWGLGFIAGAWVVLIGSSSGDVSDLLAPALAMGALVMGLLGHAMDRLRANRWLWIAVWLVAGAAVTVWALSLYPSYERAMAKNGSLATYVLFGATVGLYASVLVSLAVGLGRRLRSQ